MNPAIAIGDFVYKYESIIKPALEKRELKGLDGIIMDVCMRGSIVEKISPLRWKKGSFERYKMALIYLNGQAEKGSTNPKLLDLLITLIDKQVNELDIIMQSDESYERAKKPFSHQATG